MQEWVRKQNIEKFAKLLTQTTDPDERRILLQLLAAEEAKALPPRVPKGEQAGRF